MTREMFINARRSECRIAIAVDGKLSELYVERGSAASHVGSIYKGCVTNVEPSIQAAFVDFGGAKNGFLHISDLHPQYFPDGQQRPEAVGRKRARRDRPPIQNCIRRGQEVIVQVTKEGIGTKGATLTTYVSIPGRYLVLMPGMHRLGVSRKVEDDQLRTRMRAVLEELKPPPDMGFIVRTAGIDHAKRDLQRDLNYLLRLWKVVTERSKEVGAPTELYQESDLVIRTIRDVYNTEIKRIVCDDEAVACKVKEFLKLTMPRSPNQVELYEGDVGLFHIFGLEHEVDAISSPHVPLPSGGSLIIDQAEALVAIDVNSGRFRSASTAEATALRTNTEAAAEAARQLRLRDLGGVVVIDFIDMTEEKNRRKVENTLRDAIREDRARTKVLRMSRFGIVELTRQRMKPSLIFSTSRECPYCDGAGRIRTEESQSLAAMRMLHLAANVDSVANIDLTVAPRVAEHILNHHRGELTGLENTAGVKILVHGNPDLPAGEIRIETTESRGSPVNWQAGAAHGRPAEKVPTRQITPADLTAYRKQLQADESAWAAEEKAAAEAEDKQPEAEKAKDTQAKGRKRERRPRRKKAAAEAQPQAVRAEERAAPAEPQAPEAEKPAPKRPRRRRRPKAAKPPAEAAPAAEKPDPGGKKGTGQTRKTSAERTAARKRTRKRAAKRAAEKAEGSDH